jgi:hypothetical protein
MVPNTVRQTSVPSLRNATLEVFYVLTQLKYISAVQVILFKNESKTGLRILDSRTVSYVHLFPYNKRVKFAIISTNSELFATIQQC